MAHSYLQTLIARFGFADPDRQNPLHEAACRYLTSPTGREAVVKALGPGDGEVILKRGIRQTTKLVVTMLRSERERTIVKGTGNSRSTVGFLDAVLHFSYRLFKEKIDTETGKIIAKETVGDFCPFIIEVKIHHENIGQVLRQINFYRDYINDKSRSIRSEMYDLKGYQFVLATRYEPTAEELETLEEAQISHILLGKGFDRYLAEQETSEAVRPCLTEV